MGVIHDTTGCGCNIYHRVFTAADHIGSVCFSGEAAGGMEGPDHAPEMCIRDRGKTEAAQDGEMGCTA